MYLKAADDNDLSLRVLECRKNNYGPISETILLRWRDGVYVPEPRAGSLEKLAEERKVDNLFLDLLRRFAKQGRNVSAKSGTSYGPSLFAQQTEAKEQKANSKVLREAMERLFAANKIMVVTDGPPSHPRTRIVEVAA